MGLPTGIHTLSQTVERDGGENTVHPVAVSTPKGIVLVDTGYTGTEAQIASNLEEGDLTYDDVRGVVLTHQDGDHAGALEEVVLRTDALVFAHESATPYIDGRKHPIKSPAGERYEPVAVDVNLVDGISFRTDAGPIEVVFTPGHAPGHISLYFTSRRSGFSSQGMPSRPTNADCRDRTSSALRT